MLRAAVIHTSLFGSCVLLFLFGASGTCFAQKTLAWKLPQGRILRVQMDQTSKMKLDGLPPAKAAMSSNTTLQKTEMAWTVLDVSEDKTARVEQAVTRIAFEMQSPGLSFVIDTNDKKPVTGLAATMANSFNSIAGTSFDVSMKPSGEITQWTVPDETRKKWIEGNGGLSESGMRELSMNSTMQLPRIPIRVGDDWQQKYEIEMQALGKFSVTTTYQYLGEEEVNGVMLDKIRATTALRSVSADEKAGIKLNKQESLGTIWFNNVLGCIDHSEFHQDISMEVLQGELQIKQVVNQDLNLRFIANP
jgi:hypothetical protein